MKNLTTAIFVFLAQIIFPQNVFLTKVEKTKENTDKFLYHIDQETNAAEYLGEIEVQGFSKDDATAFSQIYKKAKEVGGE